MTIIEMLRTINELKDKATGLSILIEKVTKTMPNDIVSPLEHIYSLSIEKSMWPNELRTGDRSSISNYRHISLISNLAKSFEKIMYNSALPFETIQYKFGLSIWFCKE